MFERFVHVQSEKAEKQIASSVSYINSKTDTHIFGIH